MELEIVTVPPTFEDLLELAQPLRVPVEPGNRSSPMRDCTEAEYRAASNKERNDLVYNADRRLIRRFVAGHTVLEPTLKEITKEGTFSDMVHTLWVFQLESHVLVREVNCEFLAKAVTYIHNEWFGRMRSTMGFHNAVEARKKYWQQSLKASLERPLEFELKMMPWLTGG